MHDFTRFSMLTAVIAAAGVSLCANAATSATALPSSPSTVYLTEVPSGAVTSTMVKEGDGFLNINSQLTVLPAKGSLTSVARDGNDIYIGHPFSWHSVPGLLKGQVEGDKATFAFPQLVNSYVDDINGVLTPQRFYAVVCDMVVKGSTANMVPTEAQTYTFTIGADGSLTPDDPELFLGEYYFYEGDWDWTLNGDFYTSITPIAEQPAQAPADADSQPMVLTWPHSIEGSVLAAPVSVAFDGDDCYVKGIAVGIKDLPDAVVKGSKEADGTYSFPSNQYLGESWLYGFTQYFITGDALYQGNSVSFEPQADMVFSASDTDGTLTSDMSFIIAPAVQEDPEELYYEKIYQTPTMTAVAADAKVTSLVTPADEYVPAEEIDFMVSMLSAEGCLLDMSKLYFEVWTDDTPYTFTKANYPSLNADTTQIPFGYSDMQGFVYQTELLQQVLVFNPKYETLRLRLVYKPSADETIYSDYITVQDKSGVDLTLSDGEAVAGYFDLQGRPVVNPSAGLYIRAIRKADGSVNYQKAICR